MYKGGRSLQRQCPRLYTIDPPFRQAKRAPSSLDINQNILSNRTVHQSPCPPAPLVSRPFPIHLARPIGLAEPSRDERHRRHFLSLSLPHPWSLHLHRHMTLARIPVLTLRKVRRVRGVRRVRSTPRSTRHGHLHLLNPHLHPPRPRSHSHPYSPRVHRYRHGHVEWGSTILALSRYPLSRSGLSKSHLPRLTAIN